MRRALFIFLKDFIWGEYVSEFSRELGAFFVKNGFDVHLICFGLADIEQQIDGMTVHRTSFLLHGDNFFDWVMLMNNELKRRARDVLEKEEACLVVANDWVVMPAAESFSQLTGLPLLAVMHSTEHERGFNQLHSRVISDIEWGGCYSASLVMARNQSTAESLKRNLGVPAEKILLASDTEKIENALTEVRKKCGY